DADDTGAPEDGDDLVGWRAVDRDRVHGTVAPARGTGEVDMDAGSCNVGPAEIVDYDVVRAAEGLQVDQLDAVEVHGDVVDVAGEAHASTVGGYIDVLGDVDAVEVEPVDAVLTVDGIVAVALIPLEDVVAGAEEGDVVARASIDEIVAAATIERVI